MFPITSSRNAFQLFRGQFLTGLLRQCEEFLRGLRGFDLFLLFIGEGAEDVLGNVPGRSSYIQFIMKSLDLSYNKRIGNTICEPSRKIFR